jgi:S1-C subfamily serine protease
MSLGALLVAALALAGSVSADEPEMGGGPSNGLIGDPSIVCGSILECFARQRARGDVAPEGATAGSEGVPAEIRAYLETGRRLGIEAMAEGTEGQKVYKRFAQAVCFLRYSEAGESWIGSGCFVLDGKHILTNQHVADHAGSTLSYFLKSSGAAAASPDGYARTLAVDHDNDLALLRIMEGGKMAPTVFQFSTAIEPAMKVYAIGHPKGVPWAFTEGVVSQVIEGYEYQYDDGISRTARKVILTQTPIDPGNSGGALMDGDGRLVGITAMTNNNNIATLAIAAEFAAAFAKEASQLPTPPEGGGGGGGGGSPSDGKERAADPKDLRVTDVWLTSDPDMDAPMPSTFDWSPLYTIVKHETTQDIIDVAGGYDLSVFLWQVQPDGSDGPEFSEQALEASGPYPFDNQWEATTSRIELNLKAGSLPAGQYKFGAAVRIGKIVAWGYRTITVN